MYVLYVVLNALKVDNTQPAFTCSKLAMETPEQCLKSVQS